MAPDPFYRKLLEISWRRKLTESEAAELQAWLAAHPEIHAEWQEEAQLNELLEALPDAPMPSNFTARVLAEVEREEKLQARAGGSSWRFWNWPFRWLPRAAFAAVVLGSGLLAYHQHVIARERRELAVDLAKLAAVGST